MKTHPKKALLWSLVVLFIVCLLFILYFFLFAGNRPTQTVVKATCTEDGYILTSNLDEGTTTVENLPALGHDFDEWQPDNASGTQNRTCQRCGLQEYIRISTISDEAIPKLYLTGSLEGIGKKAKVALETKYISAEEQFECFAIMTLQGHSTFGLPKHNYTVRFYDDDASVQKHKLQFKNWGAEHKYILKANFDDLSLCRNLVGAHIWTNMTACREGLSPRIAALPTLGAVDGFPVEVYLNGEFFGLYTMNLHKDDDLYQMKDGEQAAMLICNKQTTDEALFRDRAVFLPDYSSDWEIEFCGTEDETWARNSFNTLIDFVMYSSDAEFCENLPKYLDVNAAVDYLIFIYSLGLQNSGAKDLVMLNYGDVWIPSAYDMDEAFGLNVSAASYLAPDAFIPVKANGVWNSGTGSLLWDRLLTAYEEEIIARYRFLRKDVLSEQKIISMVEEFVGSIPEASYDMDMNLYSGRPLEDPDMKDQIIDYVNQRFVVLDSILEVE